MDYSDLTIIYALAMGAAIGSGIWTIHLGAWGILVIPTVLIIFWVIQYSQIRRKIKS